MSKAKKTYAEIVEKMGGDPGLEITEEECLSSLRDLSERDFLCGAYWAIKNLGIFSDSILHELSLTKNREEFEELLRREPTCLHFGIKL